MMILRKKLIYRQIRFLIFFADLPDVCDGLVVTLRQKSIDMGNYYNLPEDRLEEIRKDAPRFNETWTTEEKDRVCALFRSGMRVNEIAGTVHRTVNAIRIKLIESGEIVKALSRRGELWTEAETERLGRFHSQGYPVAGCAKLLGRLRAETEDKLVEIGLMSPQEKVVRDPANPNAFTPWTEEESGRLKQELSAYRESLSSLFRIAKDHGRSVCSIVSRAEKMGLCSVE